MEKVFDIVKIKEGDKDEFSKFYETYKRSVFYNVLSILKDRNLSEDALMETFLKFLESKEKLNPKKSLSGYLMKISRNIALDMIKKAKKEVSLPEESENYIGEKDPELEGDVINNMKKVLNEKELEIVVLHVVNEYSHKEIANILNRPIGTITWSYNNSMKKLREAFKDYER